MTHPTTFRETCGTLRGALAHQAAGEALCGWCMNAERVTRLSAERITIPESRAEKAWLPVTEEDAARNAALLDRETKLFEQSHPAGRDPHWHPERAGVVVPLRQGRAAS